MQDKQEINAQGRGVNTMKQQWRRGEEQWRRRDSNEWDYSVHRRNDSLMEANKIYRRRESGSQMEDIRSKHTVAGLADFLKTRSCLLVQIIPKIISQVNVAMAITVQSSLPQLLFFRKHVVFNRSWISQLIPLAAENYLQGRLCFGGSTTNASSALQHFGVWW